MDIYNPKGLSELRKRIKFSNATFYVCFIKFSIRDKLFKANTLADNVYLSHTNKLLNCLNKHVMSAKRHESSKRLFLFSSRRIK
jgi:hypothetical protein